MDRERYKRLIMFFASLLVVGLQTANFAYIWFTEYNRRSVIQMFYWRRGNWVLIGLYAVIIILMSKLFGAFKVGYMRVQDVIIAQICSVICTNIIAYIQLALIGRWKFPNHIGPMLRLTATNLVLVILWVIFMRWIYNTIYPPKSVILVYDQHNPEKLLKNIASRRDKYEIEEAVPVSRGSDYIKDHILNHEACILGDIPSHERNLLVKYCFEKGVRCYCSPKISDIMLMGAEKIHMFDTPLLLMRNRGLTAEQQFVKRLLDVVVCTLLAIILSPLLLIIALLVKVYDRGPVFYRQERLTQYGRVFQIIKFRSMRVDSETKSGARLAAQGDSRITPVGRVLRKIHFDELPQLFNIIRGDMSIVGPRPERPQIAAQYEKEIPEFSYRLKVKAGLTGYAQVYGKYNTKPYDKLKLDLTYIENYSLLLDLQLVATTVKVLFQRENTEGVDASQKTASRGEEFLPDDPKKMEQQVENTIRELKMEEHLAQGTPAEVTYEEAAALPKGVRAKDVAASQLPGLLVSVIIPVYNSASTLKAAIDSVLAQDMHFESADRIGRGSVQELEILVVDDNSTDNPDSVMQQYEADPRVIYLHNKENLGAAKTRNRGVLLARGKYVAYLDSDDMWRPDKLKKQFARIFETGDVLCCTGRELIKPDGSKTGRVIGVKPVLTYRDMLVNNQINCSSVVMLTEVARRYPMIHEDSHEDYITWMSILNRYDEVCAVDEPLILYRVTSTGKSGSKFKSAKMRYRAYRYLGFGPAKSAFLFVRYAFRGVIKYARA